MQQNRVGQASGGGMTTSGTSNQRGLEREAGYWEQAGRPSKRMTTHALPRLSNHPLAACARQSAFRTSSRNASKSERGAGSFYAPRRANPRNSAVAGRGCWPCTRIVLDHDLEATEPEVRPAAWEAGVGRRRGLARAGERPARRDHHGGSAGGTVTGGPAAGTVSGTSTGRRPHPLPCRDRAIWDG